MNAAHYSSPLDWFHRGPILPIPVFCGTFVWMGNSPNTEYDFWSLPPKKLCCMFELKTPLRRETGIYYAWFCCPNSILSFDCKALLASYSYGSSHFYESVHCPKLLWHFTTWRPFDKNRCFVYRSRHRPINDAVENVSPLPSKLISLYSINPIKPSAVISIFSLFIINIVLVLSLYKFVVLWNLQVKSSNFNR